jgi:Ribbon-helix-helix protein, copG family
MPTARKAPKPKRKHVTLGGLTRETAYLYDDEERALEEKAKRERCSKSEVIRRALRMYLGVED